MILNTIKTSWEFLKHSASFLNSNKDLIFFPVISIILCISLVLLTLFTGLLELPLLESIAKTNIWLFLVGFLVAYFLLSFIIMYFNAALIACATERLQGKEASIGDGLGLAARHWLTLLEWSIIGTTVGAIIRALENSHNIIAEIVGFILGVSWSIAAYFVLPILIFENVGPFSAIKRGVKLFGRGWRKTVGVNLIFSLAVTIVILMFYGLALLIPSEKALFIDITLILFVIAIIFMATVGNAFNAIVTSALYLNIHQGVEPQGFHKELLEKAFIQKKAKG